jgi:4-hydroxyphenylpyruvate dioxygenase-like putative hemolysin
MVPYYFWGAYNIEEMNSSTNVTRCPGITDEKLSPARVFTANNTPSYLNSLVNLPMPTEEFVRNFGRRMHHMAYEVADGEVAGEKNVDVVVRRLQEQGVPFLAQVVGECTDQPNLKQIFSKSSPHSRLITEYVQRCLGYDGFFTRTNVAALTEAAGHQERYAHGHVFD